PRTIPTPTAFPRYFPECKFPSARPHFASSRRRTGRCPVCTCKGFHASYRTETACPLPLHRRRCPLGPSSTPRARKLSPTPPPHLWLFFAFVFFPRARAGAPPPPPPPPHPHPLLASPSAPAAAPALTPAPPAPQLPSPPQPSYPSKSIPFASHTSCAPYSTPV